MKTQEKIIVVLFNFLGQQDFLYIIIILYLYY